MNREERRKQTREYNDWLRREKLRKQNKKPLHKRILNRLKKFVGMR